MLFQKPARHKRKSLSHGGTQPEPQACQLQLIVEQLEERCVMSADPILDWNAVAIEVNRVSYSGEVHQDQGGPTRSSRALAIVHVAMFDAWNSIQPKYTPYLVRAPQATNASASAAVAQAAHDTLVAMYPSQVVYIDGKLVEALAAVPNGTKENRGINVGRFVAQRILAARLNDGSQIAGSYTTDGQPGSHAVDPLNPGQGFLTPAWGGVTPFGIGNTSRIPVRTVPGLNTVEYAQAYYQVKRLGELDSSERTTDQTEIGIYWGYDVARGLGDPPRLYNQIVRVIAEQEHNSVDENARMFALVNIAMADAGIVSWGVKYRDDFWRPIVAVQDGNTDGNPDTIGDVNWEPLGAPRTNPANNETFNFTPPFPAYVSGHATFGGAAFKTLANLYRTDDVHFSIPFSFISDEMNGMSRDVYESIPDLVQNNIRQIRERHFDSFSQAAAENAASRIFLGIHWRFDATEGVSAGNRIADYTFDHVMRPRGRAPKHIASVNFAHQIDAYLNNTYITTPEWISGRLNQMVVAPGKFSLDAMHHFATPFGPLVEDVMTELMTSSREFRTTVQSLDRIAAMSHPSSNQLRMRHRLETAMRDIVFSSRNLIDDLAAT